ncbi:MAG: hypothetical protein AMXMBFR64_49620 [Myxococcales bacterium]
MDVERLYADYGFYIYKRCRDLLGREDEAQDAMHEVFVRLLRSADTLADDQDLLPWLNRVTTNYCLNQLRNRRSRRTEVSEELDSVPADDGRWLHTLIERRDLVARLLARSTTQTEAVIVGYFFDELSVERIADGLGVSVPTVRRRIKEFLTESRALIERERAKRVPVVPDRSRA